MAIFEGTFEDFEKFVGPTTNKVVTRLGKQLKKKQKSCQNHTIPDSECTCRVWKRLDAGHFSHRGKDRKSMVKEILEKEFEIAENLYKINLELFLEKYEEAHHPLEENLVMLCRQHHVQYDLRSKEKYKGIVIEEDYDDTEISENEINDGIQVEESILFSELDSSQDKAQVKNSILSQLKDIGVSKDNCSFAKFKSEKWQFDINDSKFDQDYYFIFYNTMDFTFDVGKLTKEEMQKVKPNLTLKKRKTKIVGKSFHIIFDDINYKEKVSKQIFEVVYSNQLNFIEKDIH